VTGYTQRVTKTSISNLQLCYIGIIESAGHLGLSQQKRTQCGHNIQSERCNCVAQQQTRTRCASGPAVAAQWTTKRKRPDGGGAADALTIRAAVSTFAVCAVRVHAVINGANAKYQCCTRRWNTDHNKTNGSIDGGLFPSVCPCAAHHCLRCSGGPAQNVAIFTTRPCLTSQCISVLGAL
jgi:hypothetical protein